MARKIPQKRPRLTKAHIQLANEIVREELGENFSLDLEALPRNVGVKGDVGIIGATALISAEMEHPAKFMIEEDELISRLVSRLTNDVDPITRVLFDITPKTAFGPIEDKDIS